MLLIAKEQRKATLRKQKNNKQKNRKIEKGQKRLRYSKNRPVFTKKSHVLGVGF
jgi:hypothetical protein